MRHHSTRSSFHALSRLLRGGAFPCLSLALLTACGAGAGDGSPVDALTSSATSAGFRLTCSQLTIERGSLGDGQTAAALSARELTGEQDDWSKYVEFAPGSSATCDYALPAGVSGADLSSLSLDVSYRGPRKSDMRWTLEAWDADANAWVTIGDNAFAAAWSWSSATLALPAPYGRFAPGGQIKIRYATRSRADASLLDELVLTGTASSSGNGSGGGDAGSGGTGSTGSTGGSGVSSGSGSGGAGDPPGACGLGGATVARSYSPRLFAAGADPSGDAECRGVLNPERGVFRFKDLRSLDALSNLRADGYTLIYGKVLLDDYRTRDIDQGLLDQLGASFAAVRSAGLKVLPRFYYADTGTAPDAPLSRVLSHIAQLEPVLQQNADVIAVLHPGFVGAWGEWHSSTNDLTSPDSREQIFDALLEAIPENRMILARRPSHKLAAYGGPLTEETAFSGAPLSRVGHLNDCFLASDDDVGTYQLPGEKAYAAADSAFVPVGGETCGRNPPRSQCASALAELSTHHWSFINTDYHPDVIADWRSEGCFETVACRLGYRFAVMGHESPEQVARGQSLSLRLRVFNDGYARAYNPRPVYLVLQQGATRRFVQVDADPRRWAPGEESDLCLAAQLPADLPPGDYQLGVWLPDEAERLRDDPRYAIRLSSGATWDSATGVNLLDATVRVVE
ncbi:DUF4832 domain-containing protein [Sorangium sp. So ce119]|uniref:DUF4832 domain-containing protein n=1 Tax=Sorangium sp. So ce119 TaxID=3133279 RepID=UPI003F609000